MCHAGGRRAGEERRCLWCVDVWGLGDCPMHTRDYCPPLLSVSPSLRLRLHLAGLFCHPHPFSPRCLLFPAPPLLPNSIGFPPLTHPSIHPSLPPPHSPYSLPTPPTPSSSHAPTFPPFLPSLPLSFPSFTSLPSLFTFPLSLSRCGGPRGLLRRTLQRRPHERGERGERGESCYGGDA